MTKRWTVRPDGSNWGDFGEDDQLGSLNYITPQRIMDAAATIEAGKAFCLSLPLDYPGGSVLAPHRTPPTLEPTTRNDRSYFHYSFDADIPGCCDRGCDDRVTLSTQYSTQWDSLAHIGHEFDLDGSGTKRICYYNGYLAEQDIRLPQDRADDYSMPLGIDSFAKLPIQSRGVLLDVDRHFGRGSLNLTYEHIETILDADGITVEPGDILCLHTGFGDELLKMNRKPDPDRIHTMCAAIDGRDKKLHQWLSDTRIAALACDNFAIERVGLPAREGAPELFVPLHYHCLFKRGLPMGELWHLTELAAWLSEHGRHSFFLTAPPLRLPGAVGSPVTPVATV